MNFKIGDLVIPKKEYRKEGQCLIWEIISIPNINLYTIIIGRPDIIDRTFHENYRVDSNYYRLATTEEIKMDKLKNLFSK